MLKSAALFSSLAENSKCGRSIESLAKDRFLGYLSKSNGVVMFSDDYPIQ